MKRALGSLAIGFLAGCGSPRRSEAIQGSLAFEDHDLARGRTVFAQKCHACHPGGEAGLGPSLNEKPLPEFLMRLQVRRGLGAMPSFSEREITGPDLDRLIAYSKARRGAR
jgi:mono/diheme cytochrome c family protein